MMRTGRQFFIWVLLSLACLQANASIVVDRSSYYLACQQSETAESTESGSNEDSQTETDEEPEC